MVKKKKRVFHRLRTVFASKQSRKIQKAHRVLTNWEAVYKDLQSHPLTQAKIVNEQLLATTNHAIKKFEGKLDNFEDRIVKLENRRIKVIRNAQEIPLEILDHPSIENAKRRKPNDKQTPAQIVKRVVADPHMSDHEKEMIRKIQEQNELDAQTLAEQFHISRSNASLKLNKLHDWGFLSKRLVDKTVFYRIRGD